MADLIFRYPPGVIRRALKKADAPPDVRVSDVRYEVYQEIVDRLKEGVIHWPVVSGYSLLSFFATESGVYNSAEYAKYVEGDNAYVYNGAYPIDGIIREALALIGVGRPLRLFGVRRDFNFFVDEITRIAALTNPTGGVG